MIYSASDIAKMSSFWRDWDSFPPRPWLPVVDKDFCPKNPFLAAQPAQLIAKGQFNKMPIIYGSCRDEGEKWK